MRLKKHISIISVQQYLGRVSYFCLAFSVFLLIACSAAPPARYSVSHDSTLSRKDGVVLFTDICIQKDALGDADDFFLIAESKFAVQRISETLRTYVVDSAIPIKSEVSMVCAARHGDTEKILTGDNIDAEPFQSKQPLYSSENVANDDEYIKALRVISTYAFERAALKSDKEETEKKNISKYGFLAAADIVKNRTHASSILFLGVLATSVTGAKVVTQSISNFFIRFGTAIVTAGLGTGYYAMFSPGQKVSGRFLEGALIDLETGELTWSNAVSVGDDPVEKETWSNVDPLDLLFHDLFFQRNSEQSTIK